MFSIFNTKTQLFSILTKNINMIWYDKSKHIMIIQDKIDIFGANTRQIEYDLDTFYDAQDMLISFADDNKEFIYIESDCRILVLKKSDILYVKSNKNLIDIITIDESLYRMKVEGYVGDILKSQKLAFEVLLELNDKLTK